MYQSVLKAFLVISSFLGTHLMVCCGSWPRPVYNSYDVNYPGIGLMNNCSSVKYWLIHRWCWPIYIWLQLLKSHPKYNIPFSFRMHVFWIFGVEFRLALLEVWVLLYKLYPNCIFWMQFIVFQFSCHLSLYYMTTSRSICEVAWSLNTRPPNFKIWNSLKCLFLIDIEYINIQSAHFVDNRTI
jgi:hypothetical protein